MANYPSLLQCEGTKLVPRSGIKNRIASNETARSRIHSSASRWDPVLQHDMITLAEWNNLKAFCEANRGQTFTLVYQPLLENLTITCLFAEKPFDYKALPGGRFNVTVNLIQAT